ncbi:MAG: hypothetical protein KDH96_03205 [Candidatus Riesia sp.]|nr:hypothetical protein [Candidatus Riesia sp.]
MGLFSKITEAVKGTESMSEDDIRDIMSEPVPIENSNRVSVEDDDIDWSEDVDVVDSNSPEKVDKVEAEPVEPDAVPVEPEVDFFDKLEREMAKPEGNEDLSAFSQREKAYFFQMRRDRKNRQKAQEERDEALFREMKLKAEIESRKAETKEVDPLEGRDDDDLITVKELREFRAKREEKKVVDEPVPQQGFDMTDPRTKAYMELCDSKCREAHEDYDVVMELINDVVSGNADYLVKISEAVQNGTNPAEVAYNLIKADPNFEVLLPVAQTRYSVKAANRPPEKAVAIPPEKAVEPDKSQVDPEKVKKAQEAQKALEQKKVKTSAHVGSGDDAGAQGEITEEELFRMSDRDFAKLPKAKRDYYLKKYASNPNPDR